MATAEVELRAVRLGHVVHRVAPFEDRILGYRLRKQVRQVRLCGDEAAGDPGSSQCRCRPASADAPQMQTTLPATVSGCSAFSTTLLSIGMYGASV
jgi:hypothetical protein